MVLVNTEGLKQLVKQQFKDQPIPLQDLIYRSLEDLHSLESKFWNLPQAQIISQDLKTIDWKVLIKYQILGENISLEKIGSIKEFLIKYLQQMKFKSKEIEVSIMKRSKQKREKRESSRLRDRESYGFEVIIEDISSGEDADDLEQVGVPVEIGLEESHKEIIGIIEKKKMGLSFCQMEGNGDGQDKVSGKEMEKVNMKKQKNKEEHPVVEKVEAKVEQKQEQSNQAQKDNNKKEQQKVQLKQQARSSEQTQAEQIIALIIQLQTLISQNQFSSSLSLLSQILTICPSHSQTLHLKAKLLHITNQKLKSFQLYQSLLPKSNDPSLIYETALLHLQSKNYFQAKKLIDKLFEFQPIQAKHYSLKGDYLLGFRSNDKIVYQKVSENPKEILDCYAMAYNLSKKDRKYIFKIALYHINQKEYELAHQMIKEALSKDELNFTYLKSQAWLCFKLQKYSESVNFYNLIIKQKEKEKQKVPADVLNGYAISLYFSSKNDMSKDAILAAHQLYPNEMPIILNALTILRALGSYQQAFDIVKKSSAFLRTSELFVAKSCEIAIYLNNYEQSTFLLSELTRLRHTDMTVSKQFYIAYYTLGLYLNNGDVINDGLEILKKFLLPVVSENEKRQVWNILGMLKVYKKETGLEEFRKAISCSHQQQYKHAHFWNCAVAAYKNQLYRDALDLIEKAIVLQKKGRKAKYFEFRVCVLVKMFDFERALECLNEFKQGFPGEIQEDLYVKMRKGMQRVLSE